MSSPQFEQVVGAYLDSSISPGDLVWLRTEISLNDAARKAFLKKCRQHQATQYFMVQRTLPSGWGGLSDEDLDEGPSRIPAVSSDSSKSVEEKRPAASRKPLQSFKSVLEFAFISGLACVTIVLVLAWTDRHRLFQGQLKHDDWWKESTPQLHPHLHDANAVHLKISAADIAKAQPHEPGYNYLATRHLQWYLQLDKKTVQGKWGDEPPDYGIDFKALDQLYKRSLYNPEEFPHSLLDPDFMLDPESMSQDG